MPINMQDLKFKILEYVRRYGPCLPVQLSKQINSNILFAGAVLSELVANQKVKISIAKIGGSPVYYIPGQEPKLVMLYQYLHEKEKKAYDLLKQNKVLHDRSLEPYQRVALRELKDFAYPIQHENDLFWRWYMLSDEESINLIKEIYKKDSVVNEVQKEQVKLEEVPKQEIKIELPQVIQQQAIEIKKEVQPVIEQKKLEIIKEHIEQKTPVIKSKKVIKRVKKDPNQFYTNLINYLDKKKIEKLEEEITKKDKEFEIISNITSNMGTIRFLIVAKDKKKISDGDLSLAHNKAQLKKLPLIFLSNGDLTKSAKEYIEKNYLVFEKF